MALPDSCVTDPRSVTIFTYGQRYVEEEARVIQFRLDPRSGVSTYLHLVHQVRNALRLGMLRPGDQLPTVKEVVGSLAINPNTVLKAYRELEHEGLVEGRPGMGTFVLRPLKGPSPDQHAAPKRSLARRLQSACE